VCAILYTRMSVLCCAVTWHRQQLLTISNMLLNCCVTCFLCVSCCIHACNNLCWVAQLKAMQTARVVLTLEANELQPLQQQQHQQQQQQQPLCAESGTVMQSTISSSSKNHSSSSSKTDEVAVGELTWCHVTAPFAAAALRAVFRCACMLLTTTASDCIAQ
jgi:hypothetical protein